MRIVLVPLRALLGGFLGLCLLLFMCCYMIVQTFALIGSFLHWLPHRNQGIRSDFDEVYVATLR